jgi:hypothetical protein
MFKGSHGRLLVGLALVVVAIVAAGGGWAIAASSGGTIHACAKKKGGALRLASKCKKGERTVTWNVQGVPGTNGTNGRNGTNGTNGTALAYAHVLSNAVDTANSFGITASGLNHVSTGVYCFSGLTFTPKNVEATIDSNTAGGSSVGPDIYTALGAASGCPAGTQFTVATLLSNAFNDRGFFVEVN